jgi:CDP-diacylglycerol--glycerol-3-phosphate 3-phosphatidyltransferase
MTTATRITLARFFFVPPLVVAVCGIAWWPEHALTLRVAAIALFVVASATDFLDGYVARRFGQHTRVGAALDPVADKVLLGAAIWSIWACRGADGAVPLWYPVVVSANDAVLGLGYLAVRDRIDADRLRAMLWGKVATAAQIVVVCWLLVRLPHAGVLMPVAAVLTATSGAAYVVRAVRLMDRTQLQTQDTEGPSDA